MQKVKTMSVHEELKMLKQKMAELAKNIISKTFADKLTVKIGEKGTLNIYGLGRFPVCLYASQVTRLQKLFNSPEFNEFVAQNKDSLATKE